MASKTSKLPPHRFILCLADLHLFHACGMIPRDYESNSGNTILPNIGQEYLLECWDHLLRKQLPSKIDGLFLVGDILEGQNLVEEARELSETDPLWQATGGAEFLEPLAKRVRKHKKRRNIYMVGGSRYHSGIGARIEEQLGGIIGAHKTNGYHAPPWRNIDIDDVLFDVAHHQSFTIRYRAMPLEREYGFMLERVGRTQGVIPDTMVLVRAHVHKGFAVWWENGAWCISLPSMKLQDRYAQSSKYPNRLFPYNLGAVGIRVFKTPVDGVRIRVVPYLYDHPKMSLEVMKFG